MRKQDTKNRQITKEVWIDIKGYEGYYQVSNLGRIKSLPRVVNHPLHNGKYTVTGRVLKLKLEKNGYMRACLCKGGGGKQTHLLVHRCVLEAFVGNCPEGMESCHNDGDKTNNNLSNLRWDTHRNNALDRELHGTNRGQPPGEKHSLAKLTEVQARDIRTRSRKGERPCNLAREFNISERTVREIRDGLIWRHI